MTTDNGILPYILIAAAAFLLGGTATSLGMLLHKKKNDREDRFRG